MVVMLNVILFGFVGMFSDIVKMKVLVLLFFFVVVMLLMCSIGRLLLWMVLVVLFGVLIV